MTATPNTVASIPASLRLAAAEDPDLEAIVDQEVRLTFAQFDQQVTEFARAVIAVGLEPGDRAAVWAPNSARWCIAALGIMAAGGILSPINTRYLGAEAQFALNRSRAVLLVTEEGFLGKSYLNMLRETPAPSGDEWGAGVEPAILPSVPYLRTIVDIADHDAPDATKWSDFVTQGASVDPSQVDERIAALTEDSTADILFTSGTTGFPKGAMVSHGSNIKTNWEWGANVGLRHGDRMLLVNPLFHSFGYRAGLLTSIQHRATIYPVRTLDPEATQQLIQDERITVMPGAVTMYTTIMDHPSFGTYDLESVRLAVTGASVVPVPTLQRMRAELGIKDILTAYGLTESCGTATVCPPDATLERLSTTSGVAITDVEVAIMDESRNLLPPREHGEIVVRGYNVMQGYFEDPEATAKAIDADGWLHTGDVGWLDEDGYLTITDRIKDVITVGGFNVYPAEIERVLLEHDAVGQVAVIGIDDERFQQVAKAFVVLRRGGVASAEELIAHCKERLANFKVPREIEIIDQLPQTASGKIQKFLLTKES